MTDDPRIEPGAAAYRGFLFSDMRGFTAFAERHGNSAAAAAVSRFLDIARTAIARHEGAEVKTEGDAIHAVFPSASSAVLCGLEIVDAAAEQNAQEPDRPLQLGVGVHAGEAVETAEGYIGRAVNIAARLCSAAKPGEVLVSSTVKGITQSSIPVGFIPRGSRRLKGIQDPIQVYSVTRDVNAKAPRSVPRPVVLGVAAAGVVLALVAVAAVMASLLPASPTTSQPAVGKASPQPVVIGPLLTGSYVAQNFQPRFTFKIDDTGWEASRDATRLFALIRQAPPRGSVFLLRVQQVVESPCIQGGEGEPGPEPDDVIEVLEGLTGHVVVANIRTTQVGGWRGRQADITILESALAACGGLVGADVPVFVAGGEVWSASSGEQFRLLSVSDGEETVTILLSLDWTESHSVQELENLFSLGSRLLADIEF